MKGTEKLIAHIKADADAQVNAILAQAEQQCAGIRGDFDKQAAALYAERLRAGVKETQDKVDGEARIARMEGRKELLAAKQELVSRSFRKAQEQIVSLPEEQYVAFLAKLAAQASVTGEEKIVLNARDRKTIGEKLVKAANARLKNGRLTLAEETGDFAGGLILRRGSIEANCTVELLVELSRSELSAQVAEILFQ
ncbi:V-type ATP synthase subunit E [uncultured Methanobrevibacter sp.]|uniref:V-type ATP synthase subunit E n=1 Tax=uncultured Methanobrevibacter sp. TaxID=253161 RepID=UPI0025F235BE|nr:V-type ATP synthase subunit E family protein [uncultured Methanobrevibacter sp.]